MFLSIKALKECTSVCDVKSCFLCRSCIGDWLSAVAIHKKNFRVKKGERIFSEGDSVNGIFFIYDGNIKVHKHWGHEKELIVRFAKKGDILGHLGLGANSFYPVSATALEPAIVCFISLDFFESTLTINNKLTYELMRFFANELQESDRRMRNLVHMAVKSKIAQALISLKSQFGLKNGMIDIELTRQDIASYAGVSYETLFKVLTDFTNERLIEVKGKSIAIHDETKLIQIINNDIKQ